MHFRGFRTKFSSPGVLLSVAHSWGRALDSENNECPEAQDPRLAPRPESRQMSMLFRQVLAILRLESGPSALGFRASGPVLFPVRVGLQFSQPTRDSCPLGQLSLRFRGLTGLGLPET